MAENSNEAMMRQFYASAAKIVRCAMEWARYIGNAGTKLCESPQSGSVSVLFFVENPASARSIGACFAAQFDALADIEIDDGLAAA